MTPDGKWTLCGEGGAIAYLDGLLQASFEAPPDQVKRARIGFHAPVPVDLLLDPDHSFGDQVLDVEDRVYIAGGRDGLWVMEAHPDPSIPLAAARVDDSQSGVAQNDQDSNRWCSAVRLIEVDDVRYLAALFSARTSQGGNRLRLYPLDDVRALLPLTTPDDEIGHELDPVIDVQIDQNPAWQPTTGVNGFAEAFGYGLTVFGTDAYVALGPHGLVRVAFDPQDVQTYTVSGGLVFGDGSHYDLNEPAPIYGDLRYWSDVPSGDSILQRSHPPFSVDVLAYEHGGSKYVVASVDHLGWVRFDVTSQWGHQIQIHHHEGKVFDHMTFVQGGIQHQQEGVSLADEIPTFARRLDLAETSTGPALAVAVWLQPLWWIPGIENEGRSLGPLGVPFAGLADGAAEKVGGTHHWTLLYRLHPPGASLTTLQENYVAGLRAGGAHVKLRKQPQLGDPQEPGGGEGFGDLDQQSTQINLDRLIVLAHRPVDNTGGGDGESGIGQDPGSPLLLPASGALDSNMGTWRGRVDWSDGATDGDLQTSWNREDTGRPGRNLRVVGMSLDSDETFQLGSSDSAFAPDGPHAICGGDIVSFQPVAGSETWGMNGLLFNSKAQWDPSVNLGGHMVWGEVPYEDPVTLATETKYGATVFHNGDPCGIPPVSPEQKKRVFFDAFLNRFTSSPRMFMSTGGDVVAAYDAHLHPRPPLLFVSSKNTPDGILVLDRNKLDSHMVTSQDLTLWQLLAVTGLVVGTLDTHPEYQNVDAGSPLSAHLLANSGVASSVQTYSPRLTKLRGPQSQVLDRWVLVVPSGSVQINLPYVTGLDSAWEPPAPFPQRVGHAMIRLFDVTTKDDIPYANHHPNPGMVAYTYLATNPSTNAVSLKLADFEGSTWAFVGDFGGSVLVFDLDDTLQQSSGHVYDGNEYEIWEAPPNITDNLPSNVFDVLPDVVEGRLFLYVGIWRHGVAVLEFLPSAAFGSRLVPVKTLQTPGTASGLSFRDVGGSRQLMVGDGSGGFRIFGRE